MLYPQIFKKLHKKLLLKNNLSEMFDPTKFIFVATNASRYENSIKPGTNAFLMHTNTLRAKVPLNCFVDICALAITTLCPVYYVVSAHKCFVPVWAIYRHFVGNYFENRISQAFDDTCVYEVDSSKSVVSLQVSIRALMVWSE